MRPTVNRRAESVSGTLEYEQQPGNLPLGTRGIAPAQGPTPTPLARVSQVSRRRPRSRRRRQRPRQESARAPEDRPPLHQCRFPIGPRPQVAAPLRLRPGSRSCRDQARTRTGLCWHLAGRLVSAGRPHLVRTSLERVRPASPVYRLGCPQRKVAGPFCNRRSGLQSLSPRHPYRVGCRRPLQALGQYYGMPMC